MKGKVSIIIPAFNSGEFIAETLESVLGQTYKNWECVIADDGSTDDTARIAKDYCRRTPKIKYLYQENQGPSVARNYAIHNSDGEFILPLDADDTISETFIEKAATYLTLHPETTLVYSKGDFFGEESGEWKLPEFIYDNFIWQNCICSCAMFRRTDYDRTSGYNPNMIYGDEDWDFWLSMLQKDSIVHRIDETLFHYRVHRDSRTAESFSPNLDRAKKIIYYNHQNIYHPYLEDIVLLHDKYNTILFELQKAKKDFSQIHNSHAYRIGKCLLKPLSLFRKNND